jgi:hypothetical protein
MKQNYVTSQVWILLLLLYLNYNFERSLITKTCYKSLVSIEYAVVGRTVYIVGHTLGMHNSLNTCVNIYHIGMLSTLVGSHYIWCMDEEQRACCICTYGALVTVYAVAYCCSYTVLTCLYDDYDLLINCLYLLCNDVEFTDELHLHDYTIHLLHDELHDNCTYYALVCIVNPVWVD